MKIFNPSTLQPFNPSTLMHSFARYLLLLLLIYLGGQQLNGASPHILMDEPQANCDQYTVKVCIVDECGNPLMVPRERLEQLAIVVNSTRIVSPGVSLQDEDGCVTLSYYNPTNLPLLEIRVIWRFQQNGCPDTHPDCTGEQFTFGIDHVQITGPDCHEVTTLKLSNFKRRGQLFLYTDGCTATELNRVNRTIDICANNPKMFLEINPSFLGQYRMSIQIEDNSDLDDNGNPTLLASESFHCSEEVEIDELLVESDHIQYKTFICPIGGELVFIERLGIDIQSLLDVTSCEQPKNITLRYRLFCCDSEEPFFTSTTAISWQPDVEVPDPLFYLKTENNIIEGFSDGTKYDNGISGDDLLINADNDINTYTGDGPVLGTTSGGLGFDANIGNYDCVEKFEIELYEFPDCGIEDWETGTPISVDHDQDPLTAEISRFDITSEVTPNGYDALFSTLAVDPIFGESLIPLKPNTCYYAKVILTTQCEMIERFGRFQTANCTVCREVDLQEERVVIVYPTIVDHQLTIGSNIDFPETVDVTIYDAGGRVSLNSKHQGKGRFIHLYPTNLHSGLYFVEIRFENEKIVHKVLVK